jgi:mRNA-degrading endonuclease toxin of MazEF toxin-antitoxin module
MNAGEVYMADLDTGRRPAIVVSRAALNRGHYAVVVLCTSADFATRSRLPHCAPFRAGEFGFSKDCVAQGETILFLDKSRLDPAPIGVLTDERLRDVIRAVGNVLDADCEPV